MKNMKDESNIKFGDVPGDIVSIGKEVRHNAEVIFPKMLQLLPGVMERNPYKRAVITVCGGSGAGKSGVASLLTRYFEDMSISSYVLSGDNYPRRIPLYNDAERLHIFRESGINTLLEQGEYSEKRFRILRDIRSTGDDADPEYRKKYPWIAIYQDGGKEGLRKYLGTPSEIHFGQLDRIISSFKQGEDKIWLRRLGREDTELWYDEIDFSNTQILLVEWTHGNSDYLTGIDISVLLCSTPEETMYYRKARNRDLNADSPFTTMVLAIEQELVERQAHKSQIIISRSGELMEPKIENGPMLNAYPDSMGGTLGDIVEILNMPELNKAFTSFYILPSIFHSDLDRGFSIMDYQLEEQLASEEDLKQIRDMGIDLKLDFVLNHASVRSMQFQDILSKGRDSEYKDFFIDWNKFWEGYGSMTAEGYMEPEASLREKMVFRKPGLPILMVRMPDGSEIPYWNTFYQEVTYESGDNRLPGSTRISYQGQMDLNIKSPMVWDFYADTLKRLASYGAAIIRLDAFAYASKEPGKKNFLNEPETWELLNRIRTMADQDKLTLLPEIHAAYEEGIHEKIAGKGYLTYDFFLPGLILDALEEENGESLAAWAREQVEKGIRTVNMLGCHDGIPILDLKGLIPEERIRNLIDLIVKRGGRIKELHGKENIYYQVNATYYSALGADDRKMLLARALQLFMPGKPQIWYLDLFMGKNDLKAASGSGDSSHKEINRTNLSLDQVKEKLTQSAVQKQLALLRFRATFPAFSFDAKIQTTCEGSKIEFLWEKGDFKAQLSADLHTMSFHITGKRSESEILYEYKSMVIIQE